MQDSSHSNLLLKHHKLFPNVLLRFKPELHPNLRDLDINLLFAMAIHWNNPPGLRVPSPPKNFSWLQTLTSHRFPNPDQFRKLGTANPNRYG